MRRLLSNFTGIITERGTGTYLGLPECFSGSKKVMLQYITDRLKSRLNGWYEKTLSMGGKDVLLKSVAMALPVYAMSCFRLSKYQCQKLNSAMSNFWWNEYEGKKKMHWVAWEKMCKPKMKGGLGFRDIEHFNQALLAKQAWRLIDAPESLLSRVFKARYFASQDFLTAGMGTRPSYAWRSIMFGRELLDKGLMKSIGNGHNTGVWTDKWVFDELPRRPCNKDLFYDLNLKVSQLIGPQGGWEETKLQELFIPSDVVRIRSFPPNLALHDRLVWAFNRDGKYTVKSGVWLLNKTSEAIQLVSDTTRVVNDLKTRVWSLQTLPKIQVFLWRALSDALAVAECFRSHGIQMNSTCQLCSDSTESISHVFFDCKLAGQTWCLTTLPLPPQGFSSSLIVNLAFVLNLINNVSIEERIRVSIPWLLWGIWKARNAALYAKQDSNPHMIISTAISEAEEWFQITELQSTELRSSNVGLPQVSKLWTKPGFGTVKCNVQASWSNASSFCGGAWILRDYTGAASHHGRDAFLPSINRIVAKLQCLLWAILSIHDLHIDNVEIWSDYSAAISAIMAHAQWPRYRSILSRISQVCSAFHNIKFYVSHPKANTIAKDIASSVTRDGRFNSYLATGGPAWLHNRIEEERRRAM